MQIVPYLAGGLTVFLMMDAVPIRSPSEQFAAMRVAISAPAPLLGTPASNVNRAAKSNRLAAPRSGDAVATEGLPLPDVAMRQHSNRPVKPGPIYEINERADDNKRRQLAPKVPVGCEPSFSPVAAPALAHHTGRCMT
jgi:hypothetical protein